MSVLSSESRACWDQNGYVVVHEAVPPENLIATVAAIWEFLEIDPNDHEAWYKHKPHTSDDRCSPISAGGMVEIYQHQALWDNRQHPRVHQAFAEILGDEKLWVSIDRANMKPPTRHDRPEWCNEGMIHWDVDTSQQPVSFGLQGVLYLTDTTLDQGGFQCVPGFHRLFEDWVKEQPSDRDPRRPDIAGLQVESIPGRAGDLLIWHRLLAHGNGRNNTDRPRMAQYITMSPAPHDGAEARSRRIAAWRECRPEANWPGDARDWEHRHQRPASLTHLGRKLLGLDSWN